jgi:SAM-dependent methyltransferase
MSAAHDWARDFFTGPFVDLWLQATGEQQTRAEADFLEKALRLTPGAKVLDLACGGGRHALELAARGYRVTGVDLSAAFLAVARKRAAERQLAVTWEERPMQDLPWPDQFDGAYCLGNSMGGLDDGDTAAFFRGVARALKPGGRFAVDNGTVAECILPNLKERFWIPIGDILFLIHNRYDHARGRLEMEFTIIRDGKGEKKSGFQQVYTYRQFCGLLAEAGLEEFEGYSSPGQEPFHLGCHSLTLVATRSRECQRALPQPLAER